MEDLEDKIGTEQDRKKEAEESLKARNKLLVGIREGLDHMVQTLVSTKATNGSNSRLQLSSHLPGIYIPVHCVSTYESGYQQISLFSFSTQWNI